MAFVPDKQDTRAPDEKPLNERNFTQRAGDLLRAMPAGPVGIAAEGMKQGMETFGNMTDAAAYKAGGFVTDKATQLGLPPEVSAGLGYGTNVGVQAVPVLLGGQLGKTVGKPLMEKGAQSLYRSALKPDKASNLKTLAGTNIPQAKAAITTGLDRGINVSQGGLAKAEGMIDDLANDIKAAISGSGAKIDKSAVLKRVDDVIDRFSVQATPQADIRAIRQVAEEFSNNPLFRQVVAPSGRMSATDYQSFLKGGGYMDKIPVQLAQDIKTGTYKILNKKYGELKGAEVEAMKAVARGLKEEIAKAVPQVEKLNRAESELLNLKKLLESRVATETNKNPMGLGWLAERPLSALGFMIDRSGAAKSLLARGLNSGRGALPYGAGAAAGGALSDFYLDEQMP